MAGRPKRKARRAGLEPPASVGSGGRKFEHGHELSVRHGCYAILRLAPRAEELAADLRAFVPLASPADSPMIDALAMVLAQLERASVVVAHVQTGEMETLRAGKKPSTDERAELVKLASDARSWANTALRYSEALGLTPASRLKLGIDYASAEDALSELAAKGREIVERAEREGRA